jgi:hypothetical protein
MNKYFSKEALEMANSVLGMTGISALPRLRQEGLINFVALAS